MTDDEIIELANKYMDGGLNIRSVFNEDLIAFARAIAAKERDACAKLLEDSSGTGKIVSCLTAAKAIRARSRK